MNHRSLAFRLAVWYALLLSATFALVGAGMFYGLARYLRSSLGAWLTQGMARRTETLNHQWLMVSATPVVTASGRYLIELGAPLEPIEAVQKRLLSLLGMLLPVLVACAAGGLS